MRTQRRLGSAWADADLSALGTQVILLFLSCSGSNVIPEGPSPGGGGGRRGGRKLSGGGEGKINCYTSIRNFRAGIVEKHMYMKTKGGLHR